MSGIKPRQFFEELKPISSGCDFQFITGQTEELMEDKLVIFTRSVKAAGTIYGIYGKSSDIGFHVVVIANEVSLITDLGDFDESKQMARNELGI